MKVLRYFQNLYIAFLFLAFLGNSYAESVNTTDKNSKVVETANLVNRRVLILDFVNSNNSKDHEYLETTIPDAFLGPLNKTKSFELMSRSIWQDILEAKKAEKKDAYNEKIAIQTGKVNGADVIVMGSFAVSKDTAIINTHVIEISSGRLMVSSTKITKLDGSIFIAITQLANEISAEMKEKLPPLPQQVITQERIKYVEKNNEEKLKDQNESSKSGVEPADRKIAIFIDPLFTVLGQYGLQVDIPIGNWTHLNLAGSYNDLWAFKGLVGPTAPKGFIIGTSYRFMLTAFNKNIGRTALNGLYVSPAFQFMDFTWPGAHFNTYSFGAEVGHQWVFRNGFTLGVRAGYLYTIITPATAVDPDLIKYMIPFNVAGPTIHLDLGWSF